MTVFKQLARVRLAQANMTLARHAVGEPASALLARGRAHPLGTVGVAAGTGFVLGTLNVHPLRLPGLASLVGGGVAEILSQGTHLLAEMAAVGLAAHAAVDQAADDAVADAAEVAPAAGPPDP